jgi:phosphatidylinositol alpha-1,6-mannosyltransferase
MRTRSLRILLVTPDYPPPPGGVQTVVRNLERGLKATDHSVEVLHFNPEDYERTLSSFVPRPFWIYSLKAGYTGQFIYQQALYQRSNELIEKFDPDVVHAMHIRGWAALVAAKRQGLPTVVSTHALELRERSLAKRAIAQADVTHAVSEFTASLVRGSAGVGELSIQVIPPAIDVESFRDSQNNRCESQLTPVVTMARFVDRKNIETVIEAWKQLDEEVVDGRELVIVGDGPNRDEIIPLASNTSNVRITGWITEAEKRRLLSIADAFVLVPTVEDYDVEGFGIVYLEAQAAATPIVGSKHGGVPEAIGDAGIIIEDEYNPQEVADALSQILTDGTKYIELVQNATNRIDQFGVPAITEKYVELYNHLAGESQEPFSI